MKNGRNIVSTEEIPDQRKREFLVKKGLLSKAAKGFWILKKPEESLDDVFPLVYWELVNTALSRFDHWSVRGQSALLLLCGREDAQQRLHVRTARKTNWKLALPLGFDISLTHDAAFDDRLVRVIRVASAEIPVDIPERVLVDIAKLPVTLETRTFIAGTDFDHGTIEAIYATRPKPMLFKRLVQLSEESGRPELAGALARIIETYTHYRVVRRARSAEPTPVKGTKPHSQPWVIRQEELFEQFQQALRERLGGKISKVKKRSPGELLRYAKEQKKYDTYHSTTLEGYRVTPEEVDALLSGVVPEGRKGDGERYIDEVKNRMAIIGYAEAFDFVVRRIEKDYGKPDVDERLIKDIFFQLFKPSADAGITDYLSLTTYRNTRAFIRGTPYAPPSQEKVPELMVSLVNSLGEVNNPVIKAVLAHYVFVTIHPYVDGNGRTARLLMDYLLVSSGYQWVTIQVDHRARYFEALKQGQVAGDIVPFGEFIVEKILIAGR
ncbi:MAG: Fic family protein [Actinomycetota bacterium]